MQITEEQLLTFNSDLKAICKSGAFNFAVAATRQHFIDQLISTGISEKEKRERLYQHITCLDEVVTTLASLEDSASDILEKYRQSDKSDNPENYLF